MNLKHGFAAMCAGALLAGAAQAADITGAGATFPYPIYAKWADAYKKETGNGLNYQSIGSGGGIKQITAKTVDFGASDAPMKGDDLDKNGLVQFPAIMGGDRAKAEEHFKTAKRLAPHRSGCRIELAKLYINEGRVAEARQELQGVLDETAPDDRSRWELVEVPRAREMLRGLPAGK